MSIRLVPWFDASSGQTFHDRILRAEKARDFFVSDWTKESLARSQVMPKEHDSQEWVLIRGSELGEARKRMTVAIHREGARRRLLKPSPDAALLFRETLPVEDQEYRQIVFMHKPIRDLDQHPALLCWECKVVRGAMRRVLRLLEAYPGTIWPREAVFVFQASADWAKSLPRRPIETNHVPQGSGAQPRPCWAI